MARTSRKTILILGGGVGGIVTANELNKRLGHQHRVVIIDKRAQYLFTPSLVWVMAGLRRPEQLTKDLRRMIRPEVEVLQAEVQEIDPERQHVRTSADEIGYDYLVISLGADTAPGNMPGYEEAAHNFFDLEGAARLGQALERFDSGRIAVAISSLPYKCPAAPYEAALLVDDVLRRRGVRDRVDLQVFTPEPLPMPVAGPLVGNAVKEILIRRGIGFNPGVQITAMDSQRRELMFQDGSTASFDLLAGVPPHRPPKAAKESLLASETGWIPVDRNTLRTRFENVYAIGDVTAISLPNGKLLPKAGVFAHAEALTVAGTIAAHILGGPECQFDGMGFCWLAAARNKAGFVNGDFYADPEPVIQLHEPGRLWQVGKALFERYWMGEGLMQSAARLGLMIGSRVLGIPGTL